MKGLRSRLAFLAGPALVYNRLGARVDFGEVLGNLRNRLLRPVSRILSALESFTEYLEPFLNLLLGNEACADVNHDFALVDELCLHHCACTQGHEHALRGILHVVQCLECAAYVRYWGLP